MLRCHFFGKHIDFEAMVVLMVKKGKTVPGKLSGKRSSDHGLGWVGKVVQMKVDVVYVWRINRDEMVNRIMNKRMVQSFDKEEEKGFLSLL